MDYNAYLKKEYDKLGKKPEYYGLGKVKLVIPASYRNIDDFLNDFWLFRIKNISNTKNITNVIPITKFTKEISR